MKKGDLYPPEGVRLHTLQNQNALASLSAMRQAMTDHMILEAVVGSCTATHDLLVPLGQSGCVGIIPREACAIGIDDGTTREIAILTRVGKPVCFYITELDETISPPRIILSRRAAQQEAQTWFFDHLHCGDVLSVLVTHLESFGAFLDIGCGLTSFIGIENLSVSRIFHPSDRIHTGQTILAAVLHMDRRQHRITMTHRELLGTWSENAALFTPGETVRGMVRSVESYGIFIELTPNLSGLAERHEEIPIGTPVSVYIKSILPARMKIKLNIIDVLQNHTQLQTPPRYFITEGPIHNWVYSPAACNHKFVMTEFE